MKRSASEKPPGFNLAMEIACTLPCEPCRVPMALLCAQFGVSRQQHIRRMLGDAGIDFSANHGGGDTLIFVPRTKWKLAEKKCLAYWRRVYGE